MGSDGSVGVEGTVPILGPLGVAGSLDFDPYSTAVCGGPSLGVEGASVSAQACYNVPYGYQDVTDWAADQAAPVLAPLNDPNSFMDPLSSMLLSYKRVQAPARPAPRLGRTCGPARSPTRCRIS
jgi:hypothetical protein